MLKSLKTTTILIIMMFLLFIVGCSIPEIAEAKYFIQIYFCCTLIFLLTTLFSMGTSKKKSNQNVNISLLVINSVLITFEISAILL